MRAIKLLLEHQGRSRAALEVPSKRCASFLLRARVKLNRQRHAEVSPSEDALACLGPWDRLNLAALDLRKAALRLVDPSAFHLVGRLAHAVAQPERQLGAILLGELQGFIEDAQRLGRHGVQSATRRHRLHLARVRSGPQATQLHMRYSARRIGYFSL
jgi:hypothetical protein